LPALATDGGVVEAEEESPWCDDVSIVGGRGRRRGWTEALIALGPRHRNLGIAKKLRGEEQSLWDRSGGGGVFLFWC
jgi:hypothetical protein